MIGTVLSFREGIVFFFGGADLTSALMDRTSLAHYLCSWQEPRVSKNSWQLSKFLMPILLIWPLALLEASASLWSARRLSPWISSIPSRRPDRRRRKISCRRIATQRLGGGSREHAHRGGDIPDTRACTGCARFGGKDRGTARSMIFVAVNPRRSWCAPAVCGNRARVARHYRRAGRA